MNFSDGNLETKIGFVDLKSSSVQFHVERWSNDYGDEGQRIQFERSNLNTGNGFDWTNQYFKAPYNGTYFFSISGSKPGKNLLKRTNISFRVNSAPIGEALSSDTTYGSFSYQIAMKLNVSDKVELVMAFGKAYRLQFTGWLLEQELNI